MPFRQPYRLHISNQQSNFLGRNLELNFFINYILQPDFPAYNIIYISGQGGIGKSTLLARFIDEINSTTFHDYCLSAIINEQQSTSTNIMEKFAKQLGIKGEFDKALN